MMVSCYFGDEFWRVRVANELGAGNGKGANFATKVSVATSSVIGFVFFLLIIVFQNQLAMIFTSSTPVLEQVDKLSFLLAITILLNSVQPVLSGELLDIFYMNSFYQCRAKTVSNWNHLISFPEALFQVLIIIVHFLEMIE